MENIRNLICDNDIIELENLLKRDILLNPIVTSYSDFIPIFYAIDNNNLDIVKILIEYGADVNIRDYANSTPLIKAVEKNNVYIVELLMSNNVEISNEDDNKINAINLASIKGYNGILKILLRAQNKHYDWDNLIYRVLECIIKEILLKSEIRSNANTQLYANINTVKILLDYGFDINSNTYYTFNILILTTKIKSLDILNLLLNKIDNINDIVNENNENVLMYFLRTTKVINHNIINMFINKNININACNKFKDNSLTICIKMKKNSIVKLLLQKNADINIKDNNNNTPLLLCIIYNNITNIRLLLKKTGYNINHQNNLGETALIIATINNNFNMIKLLIDNKADINIKNNNYESALDIAIFKQYTNLIYLLENINMLPNYIDTSIDCGICLLNYKKNQSKTVLIKCGHMFHNLCINKSIKNVGNICPKCRSSILYTNKTAHKM
jgi:ankyrin repeat protein